MIYGGIQVGGSGLYLVSPWLLAVYVAAGAGAGLLLALKLLRAQCYREATENVAAEVWRIGQTLRSRGYLHRGRLVEAAALTVRAMAHNEPIPGLAGPQFPPGEEPVEKYIRELKSGHRTVALKFRSSAREEVPFGKRHRRAA